MIVLDGYTARGTDYELVHFNGQQIKYRNFIDEDPFNGYPFFTAYGHGWIWPRFSGVKFTVNCIIGLRSMDNLGRDWTEKSYDVDREYKATSRPFPPRISSKLAIEPNVAMCIIEVPERSITTTEHADSNTDYMTTI